jgi:hypothetical protein
MTLSALQTLLVTLDTTFPLVIRSCQTLIASLGSICSARGFVSVMNFTLAANELTQYDLSQLESSI